MKKFGIAMILCAWAVFAGGGSVLAAENDSENVPQNAAYAAYTGLVQKYEQTYGSANVKSTEFSDIMSGVCFIKLIDFNKDGTEELLLVYNEEAEYWPVGHYIFEVWSYENEELKMIDTDMLYGTDGGSQTLCITEYQDDWYLITGGADSFEYNYYHGYGENGFGIVREASVEPSGDEKMNYLIDGNYVSEQQWWEEESAWMANTQYYRMNYLQDATDLLSTCTKTKKILSLGIPVDAGTTVNVDVAVDADIAVDVDAAGADTTVDTDTVANAGTMDTVASGDYIFPNSDKEYLTDEQLRGVSMEELQLARNEIFARHGRMFTAPEIQQYFDEKSWYVPRYTPEEYEDVLDEALNQIEWANIRRIVEVEEMGGIPADAPVEMQTENVVVIVDEVPEEVPVEAVPEVPEEVPVEAVPEVSEEVPVEAVPEGPEDIDVEAVPEAPEEVPAEVVPEVSEEVPVEAVPEVSEEIPVEDVPEVSEEVSAEAVTEAPAEAPADTPEEYSPIFAAMPRNFSFSSGVGAWQTSFKLNDDGTFDGQFYDSNMGEIGDGYEKGTVYICDFHGKFTQVEQKDAYTYSMMLESLEMDGMVDEEYYEDNIRYVYAKPYGLDGADEFLIYLPGTPAWKMEEDFLRWAFVFTDMRDTLPTDCYGIYNVDGQAGFIGLFKNDI